MMMIVVMMMIVLYTNDDDSHHDNDNRHHDDDCIVHSSTIYDAANFVPDGRTDEQGYSRSRNSSSRVGSAAAHLQQSRISSRVGRAAAAGASWPLPKPRAGSFPGPGGAIALYVLYCVTLYCIVLCYIVLYYFAVQCIVLCLAV